MTMEMVVATKKRYNLSVSGKLQKEFVKVVREDMLITKEYADIHNANTEYNGVFFDIDEEKTAEYHEKATAKRKAMQEAKELQKALALSQLSNAASVAQKAVVESIKLPEKSEVQKQADELGIEYRSNISDAKLQERINEHLNE